MTGQAIQPLRHLLFIFFALFVVSQTFSIAAAQICYALSLVLYIIVVGFYRDFPSSGYFRRVMLFVLLFVCWLIVSALINETPVKSLLILKEEWLFGIIPVGVYLFVDEKYRRWLLVLFGWAVLLVSLYGIIQHFTGVHWFKKLDLLDAPGGGFRTNGFFGHRNTFANVFGTAAMFLFGYSLAGMLTSFTRDRLLLLASSIFAMVAVSLTFSRGAGMAMLVTILLFVLLWKRKLVLPVAGVLLGLVLLVSIVMPGMLSRYTDLISRDLEGTYTGGRVFIWEHSLDIIGENPLFGVGQGNFEEAYSLRLDDSVPEVHRHAHAHNDLLNIAAISGVPGALLFLGLWWSVIAALWRGFRAGAPGIFEHLLCLGALMGSIYFAATSLFEATFADEEVRQLLMFVWAAGLASVYNSSELKTESPAEAIS
jgi:O-antigen ligase